MARFIERWMERRLRRTLAERRAVWLAGARQTGKTTLARALAGEDVEYRNLDDRLMREAAEADPQGFVKRRTRLLVIDEAQRAPDLLPAVKLAVDEDDQPGQYLLTGSAALGSIPSVRESLAGRIARLRLRPLAQGEIAGAAPDFLDRAFAGQFEAMRGEADRDALLEMGMRGGYPEPLRLAERSRRGWHQDYVAALLDRDLKDIARIQRMTAMRELVAALAAWSSKTIDIAGIGDRLSIRRPTIESYINALEALYLVERLPAWTKTDYARVGSRDKLFMTDCGLMANLLDWRIDQIRFDSDRAGKLIETFAFTELASQVDAGERFRLHHYRDWEQREIDFLVEAVEDGALLGIEIKAATSAARGDFRHLAWFRDNLAKERRFTGIVLYAGSRVVSFGERLWAVPFGALWAEGRG